MNYTNLNQNISIYFNEIRHFSSLTREDEVDLFNRITRGDKSAQTEIFNKMAKLAVSIAKTYTSKADLLEDLIQEANMGVLDAIHRYDLSTGYRFSSYARFWMKAYIGRYLNEIGIVHHCNPILIKMANKIREKFYAENQREISEYELMDMLEEAGQIVTDTTQILNITHVMIDKPADGGDDELTVGEMGVFADRTAYSNDCVKEEEKETLSDEISRRLSKLDTREQELILLKFGFADGFEYESNKSLSDRYNELHPEKTLTEERVRQIVASALKKMK